jgi:hypothetical protein
MDTEQKEKISYTTEYIVAAGYILFFCLASILCLTFYYFTFSQQRSSPINTFATSLPPTTPTPHFLVDQTESKKDLRDDFSRDKTAGRSIQMNFKEEVRKEVVF